MSKRRVLVVIGTRPEAIKLVPVVRELKADPAFEVTTCITSQHRELLTSMLDFFSLRPDHDLQVMTPGQTLTDVTVKVLQGITALLNEERYDIVVSQGDTTTAFAAGLAGFYCRVEVAHVEAGLRSGDLSQPFPEEGNRRLVDTISDYLFAPTEGAKANLLAEGYDAAKIYVTGNTAIDALYEAVGVVESRPSSLPMRLGPGQQLVLVTAHRRESFDGGLDRICTAILKLAQSNPKLRFLYPVHPNPHVQAAARKHLADCQQVHLVPPMDYPQFVNALLAADLIMTDSGGVQEEAPALGKRILVLRETTERPEGIQAGVAELVGTNTERIISRATELLRRTADDQVISPYGDGHAARRIVQTLRDGRLSQAFVPGVAKPVRRSRAA